MFPALAYNLRPLVLTGVFLAAMSTRLLAADPSPLNPSAPVTIMIVRHGEKSATSGNVPLSEEGHARAACLAAMLQPAGVSAIFSSELTFAQETAAPLAQQLQLKPIIIPVKETDQLLTALDQLPAGSVALVVNHSGTIPKLLEKLGGVKQSPIEGFDRMFIVVRQPGAKGTVTEIRWGPEVSSRITEVISR